MGIVIAVANQKGGVAKTTSVSAIGSVLASLGYKVLMVDFDPQANLTYSFVPQGQLLERYVYDALKSRRDLPYYQVGDGLFLCPSGFELTFTEVEMNNVRRREYVFNDILGPHRSAFDFILIDCQPTLGLLTVNAIAASDRVSVPINADNFSCIYHFSS